MSLHNIYISLIAKKAKKIILVEGFKSVTSIANKLSKGVKRSNKSLIFVGVYKALKELHMTSKRGVVVVSHKVRPSIINEGSMVTTFYIEQGAENIPFTRRYKVMGYYIGELETLANKYNFSILSV